MEGIFGVLSFGNEVETNVLRLMASALESSPRVKYVVDGQLGMGVRRMSLGSDVQTAGPRWTDDGNFCATINGEIHNYDELRLSLERKGHFVSNDAELVAYLYKWKGEDFLRLLDGLFVIAIWDRQAHQLILAQDRCGGIRQMYYCLVPGAFLFASAIRSILATGMIERRVDEDAVFSFFTVRHILPPHTMFRSVKKLMPGSVLTCHNGLVKISWVDNFAFSPSFESAESTLEDSFSRAVKKRLVSDRPIGLFLSGGIDSSLAVATASKFCQEPLQTFNLGFEGERFDESHDARLIADHFGTNHQQFFLRSDDALELLPTIAWHLEEPLSDYSVVPTYWLAHFTKEIVDVALSSDGPDHLFGRFYGLVKRRQLFRAIPGSNLFKILLLRRRRLSRNPILKAAQRVASVYDVPLEQVRMKTEEVEGVKELLSAELQVRCRHWDRDIESLCPQEADEYSKLAVCDFIGDGSFGIFAKLGKMARGESLIIREPYFDREVVDIINNLPQHLKVKGSRWQYLCDTAESKFYLRNALAMRVLPKETLLKKKHGFAPPMNMWLRQKLQGVGLDKLLSPQVRQSGYFNLSYVEHILHEHLAGTRDRTWLLFMLIVFDLWHRIYIESFALERPTARFMDYYK